MANKIISYKVQKIYGSYIGPECLSSGIVEGTKDKDIYENVKLLVESAISKDINDNVTSKAMYKLTFEALL